MNNWMVTYNSSDLMHHGIKGQKWGVRRYQNPDGTLTEEGKKRVNDAYSHYYDAQIARAVGNSRKYNKEMKKYRKKASKLTEGEVRILLKKNKSLADLEKRPMKEVKKTDIEKGIKIVGSIFAAAASAAAAIGGFIKVKNEIKNGKRQSELQNSQIEKNRSDILKNNVEIKYKEFQMEREKNRGNSPSFEDMMQRAKEREN